MVLNPAETLGQMGQVGQVGHGFQKLFLAESIPDVEDHLYSQPLSTYPYTNLAVGG